MQNSLKAVVALGGASLCVFIWPRSCSELRKLPPGSLVPCSECQANSGVTGRKPEDPSSFRTLLRGVCLIPYALSSCFLELLDAWLLEWSEVQKEQDSPDPRAS